MPTTVNLKLLVILCAVSFAPSFVFVAFRTSSLGVGLVAAAVVAAFLNVNHLISIRSFGKIAFISSFTVYGALILSSLLAAVMFGSMKPIFSILSTSIILISAYGLALHLCQLRSNEIRSTIWVFAVILIALGWLKIFYTPPFFNYPLHQKATFPFSEESHFALVAGFIFCVYGFLGDRNRALFVLVNSLLLSLLYPSLAMLVYTVLCGFTLSLRISRLYFRLFACGICPVLIFAILVFMSNSQYFSSRLDFRSLDNLTALVFAQGWQLAYLNFVNTNGFGLGFQMLGSDSTVVGPLTYAVMEVASGGRALNLSDGGFLAAKIIAEFGLIGLIVLFFYLNKIIKIPFVVNNMLRSKARPDHVVLLKSAALFSFMPEVFLRGYGYFSPSVFFVLAIMFMNSRFVRYPTRVAGEPRS